MALRFQYTDGFRARGVSADIAAAELARVQKEAGELTAEAVFEAARPEDAPLHQEFVWDGDEAIRELGIHRARQIIRAVVIVDTSKKAEPPRRIYVHVPPEEGQGAGMYERLEVVARDPDLYRRACEELERFLRGATRSVTELRALVETADVEKADALVQAEDALLSARSAVAVLAR